MAVELRKAMRLTTPKMTGESTEARLRKDQTERLLEFLIGKTLDAQVSG